MLLYFRKMAKSKVTKGLLIMLALTFALWGIGDVLRGTSHSNAITYKGGKISTHEWIPIFLRYISDKFEGSFKELPDNLKIDIAQSFSRDLAKLRIIELESERLGFEVSDDMVKYNLAFTPEFQKEGNFSKELFDKFLQARRLNEAAYIQWSRENIGYRFFAQAFQNNFVISDAVLQEAIKNEIAEKSFLVFKLNSSMIKGTLTPSEEVLKSIYEANKTLFAAPEKRTFKLIKLTTKELAIDKDVKPEEIEKYYQSQKDVLDSVGSSKKTMKDLEETIKKNIILERVEIALNAKYQELEDDLKSGKTMDELGKKHNLDVKSFDSYTMDDVKKIEGGELILKEVFEQKDGMISEIKPLATEGFFVVETTNVTPVTYRTFAEVKDQVKALATQKQREDQLKELLAETSKNIRDADSMIQYAKAEKVNLKTIKLSGVFLNKNPEEELFKYIQNQQMIYLPYLMKVGQVLDPMSYKDGYVFIALKEIKDGQTALEETDKQKLREILVNFKQSELQEAYFADLWAKYDVKINDNFITEFIAIKD